MYELYPFFTNDGSVGLYNPDVSDIYHSAYGALSEAYEKFILPANFEKYFLENRKIKILDICFGIGYNSKSFLNLFLEIFSKKNENSNKNIDTIYTDNILSNIFIDAVDLDKNLFYLSPFIKTCNKNVLNKNLNFNYDKILKISSKNQKQNAKYKIDKNINFIFLHKIIKSCPEILKDQEFYSILTNKKYKRFFDQKLISIFKFYKKYWINHISCNSSIGFLHNIYYKYLSFSYKKGVKYLKTINFNFSIYIQDARDMLKSSKNDYDFIFLDAFTPTKCPALWSIDFFKLLYEHLNKNGMILTYSNSASVRNALINAGFYVGKNYNNELNKYIGTIATKNKDLIKYKLSEYDLGLINSKAGIFYRDRNLNASNKDINELHKKDVLNSNMQSSSKFIKDYRRKNNV